MSDTGLRQDIIDELEFEPSIDAADIGVAVENGVVTLTGHVPTYAQKATVEEVVWRIKGVKGMAQEIEVRPYGANKTADDEIAKRALSMLEWNTVLPRGAVQIKVQNGWLTLTGKVEWNYQKVKAETTVKELAGVTGVTNHIQVTPHISSSDVKKRIEDALRRNAEVEAKSINVDVYDGKVTLQGRVHAWSERSAAERAAWSAPGVKTVEDRITIG
jgi:osmotically-inducible protein OsmY